MNGNVLEYLVRQKDGMPNQTIPSVEAFIRWPSMVLENLQQHINIVRGNANQLNSAPVEATQAVIGDPIRITCEWRFNFRKIFKIQFHMLVNFHIILLRKTYECIIAMLNLRHIFCCIFQR